MRRSMKRMLGGAAGLCPPGFFCMDTGFVVLVAVVLLCMIVGVYLFTKHGQEKQDVKVIIERVNVPKTEGYDTPVAVAQQPVASPSQGFLQGQQGLQYAPPRTSQYPTPPERNYNSPVDMAGFIPPPGVPYVPIQVPTQGLPLEFQQMGVLTTQGGSAMSASPNRTLLPLYGRKVATSRERYNYYTRTDGLNPVQVPVTFKNRNCEDDNGCDEITSGDTVGVPLLGQTYVATTYRYNVPRYIPLI
jgi:hypothetical protein